MDTILAPLSRKWIGRKADIEDIRDLVEKRKIHPTVARVFAARHTDLGSSNLANYFEAERTKLSNPALLHDVDKATQRIRQAIDQSETILIFGDYDVDGISSVAIMVKTLRRLGADPLYHTPSRFTEGYGLSVQAVERAVEDGVSLIITVDNGISAFDAVSRAAELGVDVIVTDHHEIGSALPKAYAIVHPRYPKHYCPEHQLCGAGVAFKLAQSLLGEIPTPLFELVALATVCDQMPLSGENRILVKEGLYEIIRRPSVGMRALLKVAGIESQRTTAGHLGFQLGPRLNSAGRLSTAVRALELFLTNDENEALAIAQELDDLNRFRQRLQKKMESEAYIQISENPHWRERHTLVLSNPGWNEGLVGIVAGRIAERFHKPTLCISEIGEEAKGSGRSIPGFDLLRALRDVDENSGLFTRMGGHEAAAGFSLPSGAIHLLRENFERAGEAWWNEEIEDANYMVDAKLKLSDVTLSLIDNLKLLEPFGRGNPEIIFYVPYAKVVAVDTMGKMNEHLRITVSDERSTMRTLLAFGRSHELDVWEVGSEHELLVSVQENIWNAERRVQLHLVDHR